MENYRILEQLGNGSYGTVSKAVDKETNKEVAIKVLYEDFKSPDDWDENEEVQIMQKLNHPNICEIKDIIYHRK